MSIKVKLILSYLLVSLFIVILSVTFIASNSKVKNFITNNMRSMLTDREISNAVNSEFKNIVISLKSSINSTSVNEVEKFKAEAEKSFVNINKALNRKKGDQELEKIRTMSDGLRRQSEDFLKTKEALITSRDKMMLLFDDMDSLFRKQKGYIFVSKNTLEKSSKDYSQELNFLDRMMEAPLEIKVYISEIVNAIDDIDVEDGVFTLLTYAEILDKKAKVLLKGGVYERERLPRMTNKLVRERLASLITVTEKMIESADILQRTRNENILIEKDLFAKIEGLEQTVATTEIELKKLRKSAKKNMEIGIKDITNLSNRVFTTTVIMLVVILVLAIIVGIFSANKITTPLRKIMGVADNIRSGNLMCGQLVQSSNDEFGELTSSINEMKNSICKLVSNIKDSTEYLNHTSERSTEMTHQMQENLTSTSIEMSNLASAAEELSAGTDNIISNVQAGIDEVHNAKEKVVEGNTDLQGSISQVNNVATNLAGVSDTLNELNNASQEIGNIISIIVDIAEQTNLLALNAAIEAARAGEAGRGFAVVADEVRKLAEKTGTSTQEISSMVSSIQTNVQGVVDTVHSGIEEVESSSESITDVGNHFSEVVSQMETAVTSVEPILQIIEEQSIAIANITSTVTNVSLAADENREIIDKVNTMSDKLADLAHELTQIISGFTVPASDRQTNYTD